MVKRRVSPKRGLWMIGVAFILLAVILGALIFRKIEGAKTLPSVPSPPPVSGLVPVTLFFGSEAGDGLVREGRGIEQCEDLPECFESILQELINGPIGDLAPVLPVTGMFNSVRLEGRTAVVDFASELLNGLPAGSQSELYAVYAVTNSICSNYPYVESVLFTVEGKRMETLKGHLDISKAIVPDYSLEKRDAHPQTEKGTH